MISAFRGKVILMKQEIGRNLILKKRIEELGKKIARVNGRLDHPTPYYPGMQTGLFIKDGDSLVHRAETKGGKLFINGKEVVLDRTALGS